MPGFTGRSQFRLQMINGLSAKIFCTKIKLPGTTQMAIKSFRRVDIDTEGIMFGIGVVVASIATAFGLKMSKSTWLRELGDI